VASGIGFGAVPAVMGFVISGSDISQAMQLLTVPLLLLGVVLVVAWWRAGSVQ
jgi:fucose permease